MTNALDSRGLVMPHLDAAYRFARWLCRPGEARRRGYRTRYCAPIAAFDALRGSDAKAWLLTIVRIAI